MSGISPAMLVWQPPTTAEKRVCGVRAGDWIQVDLSYRATCTAVMVSSTGNPLDPGRFLAHVLYRPNVDEVSMRGHGRLQPQLLGGTKTRERSCYRFDPGWAFQAPWDGEIAIVAGGDSDPDKCAADIIVRRGAVPEAMESDLVFDDLAMAGMAPPIQAKPHSRRVYAPPVVGSPQVVPATFFNIQPADRIYLPSGAVSMQGMDSSNPINVTCFFFGYEHKWTNDSSGLDYLGPFAQGGGASDSKRAYFTSHTVIEKMVIWSRVGC